MPKVYGITEKKKAEIDGLTIQVLNSQYKVEQNQAIVTALTDKMNACQAVVSAADNRRATTLNHQNLADQLAQASLNLMEHSAIAMNDTSEANLSAQKLTITISSVVSKLIYSAEFINKLVNFINSKKASNPLVSDDLINIAGKAGVDANNAVALTMVALQSVLAAQSSVLEAQMSMMVEKKVATELHALAATQQGPGIASLQTLFHKAYKDACTDYDRALAVLQATTKELNVAQANLSQSQVKLLSLQAGLAAANAAVLA